MLVRRALLALFLAGGCSTDRLEARDVVEVDVATPLAATSTASVPAVVAIPASAAASVERIPEAPQSVLRPGLLPPGLVVSGPPPKLPASSARSVSPTTAPALGVALTAMVGASAAGMTPLGPIEGARFKQGEVLVTNLKLSTGQCLTVIATSDTIIELDLELHLVMPQGTTLSGQAMVLAKDSSTGRNATLGTGGNCFKNPIPIPMPVILVTRATQGQGTALVQVFVK